MVGAVPVSGCVQAGTEGLSSLSGLHKDDSTESESSHTLWKMIVVVRTADVPSEKKTKQNIWLLVDVSIVAFELIENNDVVGGKSDPIRWWWLRAWTSPQLSPLPLAVADEVAVLAGVDVAVNGDEEPLVELESAGELLSELPRAFQHLINDGRYLFGVSG